MCLTKRLSETGSHFSLKAYRPSMSYFFLTKRLSETGNHFSFKAYRPSMSCFFPGPPSRTGQSLGRSDPYPTPPPPAYIRERSQNSFGGRTFGGEQSFNGSQVTAQGHASLALFLRPLVDLKNVFLGNFKNNIFLSLFSSVQIKF
jgi:hypothetical protein